MNTGLQDAFNLGWKLALVHHGVADQSLLDSYEAERRPIAEMITKSGDDFEEAQTLTDPTERENRDRAIKAMMASPEKLHHTVMSETELIIDYCGSPIVTGDASGSLAAGYRLPDTIQVEYPEAPIRGLHQLAHRPGHTLMLLAGPGSDRSTVVDLHSSLCDFAREFPLFDTAVAISTHSDLPSYVGRVGAETAAHLGVEGVTLLAMRPDGYVGLRSDRDHLAAVERYRVLVQTGSA